MSIFWGHFCPPGSGSGSAICMRIRIRIQQLKLMRIHADPDTDPDPKPCKKELETQVLEGAQKENKQSLSPKLKASVNYSAKQKKVYFGYRVFLL